MKLGFALQLVTVRWVGAFLEDPLDVPRAVLDFVAEQLEIADPSCVKRYTERRKTRFDHQWEIRRVCDLKGVHGRRGGSAGVGVCPVVDVGGRPEGDLHRRGGVAAGAGCAAAGREHVDAAGRPGPRRHDPPPVGGAGWVADGGPAVRALDQLLEVPPGPRISDLERWRKGPPPRGSGPTMIKALDQVAEVMGWAWVTWVPRIWCRRAG